MKKQQQHLSDFHPTAKTNLKPASKNETSLGFFGIFLFITIQLFYFILLLFLYRIYRLDFIFFYL